MVVGGTVKKTEIVEFTNSNSTPPAYGELPNVRCWAVGAILGNAPFVCGGADGTTYFDSCLTLENSQWNKSYVLTVGRAYFAGVLINSTTYWMLGGLGTATEFIWEDQYYGELGPKLPIDISQNCAVKLSAQEIFLIGGYSDTRGQCSNEVWVFNPQNGFESKQGASMFEKRCSHSCSIMRDGEKTVIVVAGGFTTTMNGRDNLNSVEIYDPTDYSWDLGKEITILC